MNYFEFEKAVVDYISDNWDATLATPIDEYNIEDDTTVSTPTMTVNIGTASEPDTCFGTFEDNKKLDIHSGTVNLNFKFELDYGRIKVEEVLQAAIDLFNHSNIGSGYIQFGGCYVASGAGGSFEGKKYKTVICPFTVETIS